MIIFFISAQISDYNMHFRSTSLTGLGPEMLLPGVGTESLGLNRAAKAARGESMRAPSHGGEAPPELFLKSMYLRMHFKPF